MSFFSGLETRKQKMRDVGRSDIIDAHTHTVAHRAELADSQQAGCFYCCEIFEPKEIEDWIDDGKCALCPKCGIDSVIGDASGFPISDKTFLSDMHGFWFS